MSLVPKPYDPTQLIINAQFRGKPNILADVDINQNNSILQGATDTLWPLVGPQISPLFSATSLSYNGIGQLVYNIPYSAFSVIIRGLQFNMPSGAFVGTSTAGGNPGVRVWLIATKTLITFADDQVISGISGTELPAPMAGADHYQYQNPRLAYSEYPSTPALGSGEELICTVFSVIPQVIGGTVAPILYTNTNQGLATKLQAILGNKFNPQASLAEMTQYTLDYLQNGGNVPVGTVWLFHGLMAGNFNIGSGLGIGPWINWRLLDTNGGTPDSRGRFIVGMDPRTVDPSNGIWKSAYTATGTLVGSSNDVTLLADNLPSLQVGLVAPAPYGSGGVYYNDDASGGGLPSLKGDSSNAGTNGPILTEPLGTDQPFGITPPAIVLALIYKYQ